MTRLFAYLVPLALAACATPALAQSLEKQSLDGQWIADLPAQGQCPASHLDLAVSGAVLSGSATNPRGSFPVTGAVDPAGQGTIDIVQAHGTIVFSGNRFVADYPNNCGSRHAEGFKVPTPDASGTIADTPENRAVLARQLIEVQSPEMKHAMETMIDSFEHSMPPQYRDQFRTTFAKVFDFEQARQFSAMVMAKDLTTEELSALVAFYSSPIGHSAMTKMPQVMQDTMPFMRSVMENAMRQMPSQLRPPQFREL